MEDITERIKMWERKKTESPGALKIHLTEKCDLFCGFGPDAENEDAADAYPPKDKEEWQDIVNEGRELGVEEWEICDGGQASVPEDLILGVMEKIKDYGAKGRLVTDGVFIDAEVARRIVDMQWENISISLDGLDIETNGSMKEDISSEVFESLKKLSDVRDCQNKRGSELYPYLSIETVVCSENYDKLADIVRLSNHLGFDGVRFKEPDVFNYDEELELGVSEFYSLKEELRRAKKLADEFNLKLDSVGSFSSKGLKKKIDTARRLGRLVGLIDFLGEKNE